MNRSIHFIIVLVLIVCGLSLAGDKKPFQRATPEAVILVRRAAMASDFRGQRHTLIVSTLPIERRDRAVRILDDVIVRQLRLIDEVRKNPARVDELVRQAKEKATEVEPAIAPLLTDEDEPALAIARRLAQFEERIFCHKPEPSEPDRLMEIIEKLNVAASTKATAIRIREEACAACRFLYEESWGDISPEMRRVILMMAVKDEFWGQEKRGIGAVAAESSARS